MQEPKEVFTTSNVFLDVLVKAGITHAFVNLGSDHPALLEAFVSREKHKLASLEIVTCPNEMVALSCAQGYAQTCGRPAAVIVHVDCGTQALAGAVHNVSTCRTPVLIYAGASPFSQNGELAGSRNEFIHWLQNAVDQPAILRQYMRHVGEIRSGKNAQEVVLRALQFAESEPQGPVYVWAQREATEEHLDPNDIRDVRVAEVWSPVEPIPLSQSVVVRIVEALLKAKNPLIVTSYLGRNVAAVEQLVKFVELLALPVFQSCPTYVNLPYGHVSHAGIALRGQNKLVEEADCIVIIDSDIPWIPLVTTPSPSAEIFHLDSDPLKERMSFHAFPCQLRAKVDSHLALSQLCDYAASLLPLSETRAESISTRRSKLERAHRVLLDDLAALEVPDPADADILTAPLIVARYRDLVKRRRGMSHRVLNEAISNYPHVWSHLVPDAGEVMTSGASSLGWALGAAIGTQFAANVTRAHEKDLTTVFVGDGSFVFGVPSASYWIARRYKTPFLTIIFNNGGWKSPKLSMLGVHPAGLGSQAAAADLHVSFGPTDDLNPDYGAIATAAGGAWAAKVRHVAELDAALAEAVRVVTQDGRCAVLDCWLPRF